MKRNVKMILSMVLAMCLFLTGCGLDVESVTNVASDKKGEKLTFIAKFYDNFGEKWMSAEGKNFNISPNKVKEYSYDSDGSWISTYALSSVMTIEIDGDYIESCGSTVVFADTRLEEYKIDFDSNIVTDEAINDDKNSTISNEKDITVSDYFDVQWWWKTTKQEKGFQGTPKIVIVQSQLGKPICMYMGEEVSWDIPKNLPKTTKIVIDGKALYVHRANFAIVDTSLFNK